MFKNYFKIAWRNLWKNKTYAITNLAGLGMGLASVKTALANPVKSLRSE